MGCPAWLLVCVGVSLQVPFITDSGEVPSDPLVERHGGRDSTGLGWLIPLEAGITTESLLMLVYLQPHWLVDKGSGPNAGSCT